MEEPTLKEWCWSYMQHTCSGFETPASAAPSSPAPSPPAISFPASEAAEQLAQLVWSHYEDGTRAYHNCKHLQLAFQFLDGAQWVVVGPPPSLAVQLAVWFHDLIYEPRATDNEEQSAEAAAAALRKLGAAPQLVDRVKQLIMYTKAHTAPEDDEEAALLLDADLCILGADDEGVYPAYKAQIQQEYSFHPPAVYAAGRAKVLESLLAQPSLFKTVLGKRFEPSARANLQGELEEWRQFLAAQSS